MSWLAVDDMFAQHRKRLKAARSPHHDTALALWLLAGTWCCSQTVEQMTGFVPVEVPYSFGLRGDVDAAIALLVEVGFWDPVDDPEGHTFHDWDEWNGVEGRTNRAREKTRLRVIAHRVANCQAGRHTKDCPTTQADGTPWECPKRAGKRSSEQPRNVTPSEARDVTSGRPRQRPRAESSTSTGTPHQQDTHSTPPDDDPWGEPDRSEPA